MSVWGYSCGSVIVGGVLSLGVVCGRGALVWMWGFCPAGGEVRRGLGGWGAGRGGCEILVL